MRCIVSAVTVFGATLAGLDAQNVSIAPNQNYLFLLADRASTLQTALDQAAANGLHVLFGSNEGVFLARRPADDAPGAYRAIADNDTRDFEKALNAAREQGFRLVPETLTRSPGNNVAIMRRAPGASAPYRYRVLGSDDALDKNLTDLAAQGFAPIGVFTQQSGLTAKLGRPGRLHVVLEASAGGTAPAMTAPVSGRFRAISTLRASTMEKEINEAAAEGYRVSGGSFMNVLVEKRSPSATHTYRVIGAIRGGTLTDEIQRAGREGHRMLASAIMGNPSSKAETVVVMERPIAEAPSFDYAFVSPKSGTGPLDELRGKGFTPVALVTHWDYVIVFEKPM